MSERGPDTGGYRLTDEDKERVALLDIVARRGLGELDLKQLERLQTLVGKKSYDHSKKARKSRLKLLAKINVAIYERSEGRAGV